MLKRNEQELMEFYTPFFKSKNELEDFFDSVYKLDIDDRIPRQMINQIYRFVLLSKRIEEIYPPRDGLRIMFLKICLESLCSLDVRTETKKFYEKFEKSFSDEGRKYILDNFKPSFWCLKGDENQYECIPDFTVYDFLNIIKYIRDQVVHDGIFWEIQVFASDCDAIWLTTIETDKKIIECVQRDNPNKEVLEYHFESTMQFDIFCNYFTEACINYVKQYMDDYYAM